MAFKRISFANDDGGAGEYECSLNPYSVDSFEPGRTLRIYEMSIIGEYQTEADGRQDVQTRTLRWRYRSDMTGVATMYTALKTYEFVGSNFKYFKDGSIGSYTSWTKVKVLSVSRQVVGRPYKNAVMYEMVLRMELS